MRPHSSWAEIIQQRSEERCAPLGVHLCGQCVDDALELGAYVGKRAGLAAREGEKRLWCDLGQGDVLHHDSGMGAEGRDQIRLRGSCGFGCVEMRWACRVLAA
jgi:hypothetical protein